MADPERKNAEPLLREGVLFGETFYYVLSQKADGMKIIKENPHGLELGMRGKLNEVADYHDQASDLRITLGSNPEEKKFLDGNVVARKVAAIERGEGENEKRIYVQLDVDRELTVLVYGPKVRLNSFSWRTDSVEVLMNQLSRPEVVEVFRDLGVEEALPQEVLQRTLVSA